MSPRLLYREDAYLREAPAIVTGITDEGGIVVDTPLFYPKGGGQPGDSGWIDWGSGSLDIAATVKAEDGVGSVLVPAEPRSLPPAGTRLVQHLNWDLRYKYMRVHTALHLLSVVIPLPVTGGQVGGASGRLDFLMPDPPEDRNAIEDALNALIDRDLPVTERMIAQAELDAHPELVKTMSVQPPRGAGEIRLVRIGDDREQVDLQPCGGTHVARTSEIGALRLGKIENKGKQNRRVTILLA